MATSNSSYTSCKQTARSNENFENTLKQLLPVWSPIVELANSNENRKSLFPDIFRLTPALMRSFVLRQ